MPRPKRADEANGIYHALNRGNAKSIVFKKDADFYAFERIVAQGLDRYIDGLRIQNRALSCFLLGHSPGFQTGQGE